MDKGYWLFILGYASNRSRGSPSTQEGQLVRLRGREGTFARNPEALIFGRHTQLGRQRMVARW